MDECLPLETARRRGRRAKLLNVMCCQRRLNWLSRGWAATILVQDWGLLVLKTFDVGSDLSLNFGEA